MHEMNPQTVLERHFGFASFRGCQQQVIERVLAGGHALVIMPTGGGKSLCYQVPALLDPPEDERDDRVPLTLVISPLIALMKDQVDGLVARGLDAAYINSSLSKDERESRYRAVHAGRFRLLYVTPERFRKPDFVDAVRRRRVRLLAVDEAHCISEWGHDFRPDYTRLAELRALLGHPTTLALTATATPDVQADIIAQLGLTEDQVRRFHEGIERPNLNLSVVPVWGDDEKLERIRSLIERYGPTEPGRPPGSGIVYFTLIRTLERFSDRLREERVPHVVYHGDLDSVRRRRVQNDFMTGRSPLVLATPAFGMGIDKEDIRFVMHAEVPGSMEAWYQEIGRAGRDGRPADCVFLYDERDLTTQMEFIQWSNPGPDIYERVYDVLRADLDKFLAFGLDWLRDRLHIRGRHDRRLETALGMLERYGVIAGDWQVYPPQLELLDELPASLIDRDRLALKLQRDRQKLYALVQFARCEGDHRRFLQAYFGL